MAIGYLSFYWLVWLGALAFCVHVGEELPGFTNWAQRHVNPHFTRDHYLKVHISGTIAGFAVALLLTVFPHTVLIFLYFALVATPGFLWNTVFHTGATLAFGKYCPGVATAVLLYLPLYGALSWAAIHERLLPLTWWVVAVVVAGGVHLLTCGASEIRG